MNTLSHKARKQLVFRFLYQESDSILRRYRVPEHLGDDQLRAEVNDLVHDINSQIPERYSEADFKELMPKLHGAIRRRHGTQNWPSAKTFIAATNDAITEVNKGKAKALAESGPQKPAMDSYAMRANQMKKGEPVPETLLWGRQAVELIKCTGIDEAIIEDYRKLAYEDRVRVYKRKEADEWLAEMEAQHEAALRAWKHGIGNETN